MERGEPLTATDVIFQEIIGVETTANAGTQLFCFPGPCLLSFTTGNNTGEEGPPIWTFDGGGSITMTGGLNTGIGGSGVQIVPGGSILISSGSFADPALAGSMTAENLLFIGAGVDTKNAALSAFYELGNDFVFATTELSLGGATIDPATGAFAATVTDADFQNAAPPAQAPAPATLLLLGAGLTGIAVWGRRRARTN